MSTAERFGWGAFGIVLGLLLTAAALLCCAVLL